MKVVKPTDELNGTNDITQWWAAPLTVLNVAAAAECEGQ